MNRRDFLGTSLAGVGGTAVSGEILAQAPDAQGGELSSREDRKKPPDPADVTLYVKPVMTNLLHTGTWEGPCRWARVSVEQERKQVEEAYLRWPQELRAGGLGQAKGIQVLEPAQITFKECFVVPEEELDKLAADDAMTDAFFVSPRGSSVSAFRIAERFRKPIVMKNLNCRNVDIAAYTRAQGLEAYVAADDEDLAQLVHLLRARKVFRQTRVLFPTDAGLPASCSVGSIWDLDDLRKRLKVGVAQIGFKELAEEMAAVMANRPAVEQAERSADDLLRRADKAMLERKYVVQSMLFHQTVKNLMQRHGCNAFTIECFEFCSSRLPEQWTITPCLIHSLLRNGEQASSCEADLGSLLAMRLLMSVSGKSCHQGNSDPRPEETFRINHSVPSMKMNGFGQPDVPYQLGRFVQSGWGTKVVVDFMGNSEKTVTVARVNPKATKMLILRGELAGASGWNRDLLGCSVEAVIRPPQGRCDEFLRKRLEYGNHLQWVYGDYAEQMRVVGEMVGLEVDVIR